jgi:uncharacterized protein with FMN-binding domain
MRRTPPATSADHAARVEALRSRRGPRHPAQGARNAALVASVASTVAVALALHVADRSHATTLSSTAATAASRSRPVPSTTAPSTARGSPATTTTAAGRYADGVWTGAPEYTKWGPIQVQATVAGGRVTSVVAVQSPSDRKSANINAQAQPILEREAIAQQDATLDMVSGATYTSRTYTASLQAALDRAAAAVPRASAAPS